MIVGLIRTKSANLPEWVIYVHSRAKIAQSTVRRFSRWLHNERIKTHVLYGPIIQNVLQKWSQKTIEIALDTSMLWDQFCHIRISIIYRGRAVPLVWKTIEHKSSTVGLEEYQDLLDKAATLLPADANVLFLADRGFADTNLMRYMSDTLRWHWRIRIKSNFFVNRRGQWSGPIHAIKLKKGQALFLQNVHITHTMFGPVHLALARPYDSKDPWLIVSDQATNIATLDEYGLRFDIEENFLDDKSNVFQLESSRFRNAEAISRLCLVLAIATLFLVSQGTETVAAGDRRKVDAHWFRGNSYLKIGRKWVLAALEQNWDMISALALSPLPDPEPAKASNKQEKERNKRKFSIQTTIYAPT